jgi:hypothetical protein
MKSRRIFLKNTLGSLAALTIASPEFSVYALANKKRKAGGGFGGLWVIIVQICWRLVCN